MSIVLVYRRDMTEGRELGRQKIAILRKSGQRLLK